MPSAPPKTNTHSLRHAAANRTARIAALLPAPPPSIDAQCAAVVARLAEITATNVEEDDQDRGKAVDARALESLPDPLGWGGRAILPWGAPGCGGHLSRGVKPVRAGRDGWYLQYDGVLYDGVRDAFVAARLNRPMSAPWAGRMPAHRCGCITVAAPRQVTAEQPVDIDGQLELLRGTLRHIALAAPDLNLGILAADMFAGQLVLAESYVWRLEMDGFVDHAGEEHQGSMMLTAEGTAVLLMLELTKPGTNEDVMSPRALAEAAAVDDPPSLQLDRRTQPGTHDLDIPRFLQHR